MGVGCTFSYCSQTQRVPELRVSAALSPEPEFELALV
jgi:hypothetical protein